MKKVHNAQILEVKSEPFTIIGMVTKEPMYFIAGQIHRELKIDLQRVSDFEFYDIKTKKLFYRPTYICLDSDNGLLYIMFSNTLPLVKNIKQLDILFVTIGRDCLEKTKQVVRDLNNLFSIRYSRCYYYSQQEEILEQRVENPQGKLVQLDLNSSKGKDIYTRVREKRQKSILGKKIIENLLEDLEINLCNDNIATLWHKV